MNDKIDISLAEDEDLARAKLWWKENGSSIIGGVVIGTIMVVGYNIWQKHQENHTLEVAKLYETYVATPQETKVLDELIEFDSSATYSQLARLDAAKRAMTDEQYDKAEKYLNGVISESDDVGLQAIGILRLATVLLAQNKTDEVLMLLDEQTMEGLLLMKARAFELKADAYRLSGKTQQAKDLYNSSLELLSEEGQTLDLVQLKLDNL